MTHTDAPVKIVVGVNGSRSSLNALSWAHHQARLTHGELHTVISTWTIPVNRGWAPVPEGSDWPDLARQVLDEAIAEALGRTGTEKIHRQVAQGHPARVLLAAASDADLLVVGGGTGSTATPPSALCQDLVSRAPCPVVVVRGGPDLVEPPGAPGPATAAEERAAPDRADRRSTTGIGAETTVRADITGRGPR